MVDSRTVRLLAGPAAPPAPKPAVIARSAPPAPPTDIPSVSEVVVTATKRGTTSNQLAASVSVVTSRQLNLSGAVDAPGTVNQIAGVTMTNLGPGRDKILLRGLSDGAFTGRTQSTVGTYLDDVPITYNAPDPDLRLADVEAVEVIRGPQGALYGSGSLSGVYRIVTRKPDPDRFSADVTALSAWTEGGAGSNEIEGVINAPLLRGVAALRAVGYSDVEGGYLDDVNLRLSNVDRTIRRGGRVSVSTRVGENWTVTLAGVNQHLDSNDTQYANLAGAPRRRANRVRESHRNDFSQGVLTVTGSGDWGHFNSSTAYVRHAFSSQFDASAALSLFGSTATDLGVYFESAHTGMLVEDAVLTSPGHGRLQWLVGVYGARTIEHNPSTLKATPAAGGPPQLLYEEARRDRLNEGALYGEVSYALGGGWSATLGARVFATQLSTASDVNAPLGQSRSFVRDAVFRNWSPKVSIQKQFADGDLVYALISEGHRAGGFNSGGQSAPSASRRSFAPDRLQNFEIGTKLRLFDNRLDVRSAVFYDVWTNLQTDQYLNSGLSYTANVGDGANLGWETEAAWRPTPYWTIQINTLFDAPKVTRVNTGFASAVRAGLPGVPDVSAGLLTVYRRPIRDDLSLLFTTELGYVGRSRLTFDSAFSPEMGGFATGKLSAQVLTPRWRLAAYLSNPTNAAGDTFAYGNPFSFGQVRQVTPQRPRTFGLVVAATF